MPLYTAPENVVLQKVADETVIVDLEGGGYFSLDAVGTRMVELAGHLEDIDAAVAQLEEEFAAAPDILREDLVELLDELRRHGLAA
jgi:hypothetical protein